MITSHSVAKTIALNKNPQQDILNNLGLFKKAFFTLRSVSHPTRKKIIDLLDKAPLTVTEIYIRLRMEQSVASQHLSILRLAGAVKTKRDGKFIHYSLNRERIAEIARHVEGLGFGK